MKLLICTQIVDNNDSNLGFFHDWIAEFAKKCEGVVVICLKEGTHNLPNNVRVLSLGKELGVSRLKYITRFYRYAWGERRNYDSVFVHMNPEYLLLGGAMWWILGKKVSLWYTHHSKRLLRITLPWVDTVFSAATESFPIQTKKLKVFGHGIDTDFFGDMSDKKGNNPPVILVDARISRAKNHEQVLTVSKELLSRSFPHKVVIIGAKITWDDGVYQNELEGRISTENLPVELCGAIPYSGLPRFYKKADLLLNIANSGGMNKSVLQAMSCNVPVVTSNEAYRGVLPDRNIVANNSKDFAQKIIQGLRDNTPMHSRKYVVAQHNLSGLIIRIVETLHGAKK